MNEHLDDPAPTIREENPMPSSTEQAPHATGQRRGRRPAVPCSATTRAGQPCTQWAVQGTTVCRMHGGTSPQVRAAAAERQLDAKARALLERLDVEPVTDPIAALMKLAGQVIAWEQLLAEQVEQLTEWRYTAPGSGTEQLRAEVVLFERAMDRCASVLTAIARLDLDARLARITAQQADAMVRAIDCALMAAGVSGEAADRGRSAAARHLRAVGSGDGGGHAVGVRNEVDTSTARGGTR